MATFTSTLPDDILKRLNETAQRFSLPKNKIIEKALQIYLDQLSRAEYIKSYKQAASDENVLEIAEEGMEEYLKQLGDETV